MAGCRPSKPRRPPFGTFHPIPATTSGRTTVVGGSIPFRRVDLDRGWKSLVGGEKDRILLLGTRSTAPLSGRSLRLDDDIVETAVSDVSEEPVFKTCALDPASRVHGGVDEARLSDEKKNRAKGKNMCFGARLEDGPAQAQNASATRRRDGRRQFSSVRPRQPLTISLPPPDVRES
jgi:hypothetical protein